MAEPQDSRPVPDPTLLTTQQLLREITALREIIDGRVNGVENDLNRLHAVVDNLSTVIAGEVHHLKGNYNLYKPYYTK